MTDRKPAARPGRRRSKGRRPPARTVTVTMTGEYDGWTATARADFPARLLQDLGSGDINRVMACLEAIITEYDMPDSDGNVAETLSDVDPYSGLFAVAGEIIPAIKRLPPR